MPKTLDLSKSLSCLIAVWVMFAAFGAQALTLPITLSVDVDARYTHNGVGGFRDFNSFDNTSWALDDSFIAQSFVLDFVLELQDVPNISSFGLFASAPVTSLPTTPLTSEVRSFYTALPSPQPVFNSEEVVLFSERDPLSSGQSYTQITDGETSTNFSNLFSSTRLSSYTIVLSHLYDGFTFPVEQLQRDAIVTKQAMASRLISLHQEGAVFLFAEQATSYVGNALTFQTSTASANGLKYTGTAAILSIDNSALIPLPATLWLFVLSLVTMRVVRLML